LKKLVKHRTEMSISEILRKSNVDQFEMIAVVEHYIKVRTGIEVDIWPRPTMTEGLMLNNAFVASCEWLAKHPEHQ
jgi:hypothetical protein